MYLRLGVYRVCPHRRRLLDFMHLVLVNNLQLWSSPDVHAMDKANSYSSYGQQRPEV